MSPRFDSRFPPPSRPRPVAGGGIAARSRRGAIGETWWSQRFVAVLESFDYASRLKRGRTYARAGQVIALDVARGLVTARVQGSRVRPYRVTIALAPFGDADWARAQSAMAERALFAAKLLAGEMPREIEEVFSACELSLFPGSPLDLSTKCSCPDWANPCKHVAATYYLLAEAFDQDPFLILAWRGRTREALIGELRALRRVAAGPPAVQARPGAKPSLDTPLETRLDTFWQAGAELGELAIRPRAVAVPDALLREGGPPPGTASASREATALHDAYRTIAHAAERRALGER